MAWLPSARAIVAVVTAFSLQQTPPAKPTSPVAATGVLMGQVVDSDGTPVSNALVTAGTLRTFANQEGKFVLTGVPKGGYQLNASKPGYMGGSHGRLRPGGPNVVLDVADGERHVGLKLTLWRFGVITGTLFDDTGQPLVGVPIWSLHRRLSAGRIRFVDGPSATTDDRGIYRLSGMEPGDYALCVVAAQSTMPAALLDAYGAARVAGTTSEFQSRFNSSTLGFTARVPTAGIRVDDAVLHTVGPFAGGMIPPMPGEDGVLYSFRTTCHPNAVALESADIVTVAAGDVRMGADIHLKLVPGVTVAGTVLGPEGPVPNVGVRLAHPYAGDLDYELTWEAALTISDARGRFTFLGVPPGNYTLHAFKAPVLTGTEEVVRNELGTMVVREGAPPPIPPDPTYSASMSLAVGAEGIANMSVRLATGFRLTGRLVFEGTAGRPPAAQLSRIQLQLQPADGHHVGHGGVLRGRTEQDGTFATAQIPGGRYVVRAQVEAPITGYRFKAAMLNGRDVSIEPVELRGDLSNLQLVFADAWSELSGLVRDDQGRPDTDAIVVAFPVERTAWTAFGEDSRQITSGRTDRSGRYRITALPPGQYFLAALDAAAPVAWQDPRVLESLSRTAERVTITAAEKTSLDLITRIVR